MTTSHEEKIDMALLKQKVRDLEDHIEETDRRLEKKTEATDKKFDLLEEERNKALKWGVMALGGMVISLITWIVNVAKDHIK